MSAGFFRVPRPSNEPVRAYAPGSPERAALEAELAKQAGQVVEIPCVVGGEHRFTGNTWELRNPCAHGEVLARVHLARPEDVRDAIESAEEARESWAVLPHEQRAAVFLRAASLLTGPWRQVLNASTMLGQAKTAHQAEIDVVCELADFWRFNCYFAEQLLGSQPPANADGTWNRLDHRPLDGFVFAVSPFNFTSIALNLPTAPALMGNTALWKPALTSALGCWYGMRLLEEAGLPPGVVNMLHGHGPEIGDPVLADPRLGGIHFTGSTATFQRLWRTVGENLPRYRAYPRVVGETGGKDFVVAHPSADAEQLAVALLRGAFEYQGQKCSAASRAYIPRNLWNEVKERLIEGLAAMRQGDVRDLGNFVGAVIDRAAFEKHRKYLELAHSTATVVAGGEADDRQGWFVQPTVVQVDDPHHRLMEEEIFGPILTVFVYEPERWTETLLLVDSTSPYALTGAVFARDRLAIDEATEALRFSAGNFYINDKPTGAVVGQQPFGGGRASGTNDKAGSELNLMRWVSPRTIKETFDPPRDWRYPFLG